MNDLVIMHDKRAVTTSLQVAETFGKQHKDVLEAIETKIQSAENSADYKKMFAEGTYKDGRNRDQKLYYMNRDGFTFIAFGFTGKKADSFKLQYIDAFNAMETTLKKVPAKKLDPVLQAELAISRAKTAQANALYRIANKTTSESAREQMLSRAAEIITGECLIPVMKQAEYTAGEVARKLGISSGAMVGRISNALGLKAEQPGQNEYGRWAADKSQHGPKETPNWLYFDKGVVAIKAEALRIGKLQEV
ncbi:Rha family transcriptional regulator [Lacticaseibacillus parakribbianus]|uniref:Rha family transcriptional regulator n=1 Tax=Lacticaseibacillus parakribbianus TaxID=2970927 RepID=UPI0021CB7D30|nr:Rha family transcriptional regulator [Lacticaseibacillus parakribbianus]